MWTIQIVPFAAISVKAVSDAKPHKAKPKNEHQGRTCVAFLSRLRLITPTQRNRPPLSPACSKVAPVLPLVCWAVSGVFADSKRTRYHAGGGILPSTSSLLKLVHPPLGPNLFLRLRHKYLGFVFPFDTGGQLYTTPCNSHTGLRTGQLWRHDHGSQYVSGSALWLRPSACILALMSRPYLSP
jgi:hypothetical protein